MCDVQRDTKIARTIHHLRILISQFTLSRSQGKTYGLILCSFISNREEEGKN